MIMPSRILIEADECTHELGKIIHNKPSEWNVQVEIVENTEVVKLVSSHIEYRLVFTAVPKNNLAKDIRRFAMWTRFRDLKRLWEVLVDLHKILHLQGSFPKFSEAVIFGNKRGEVVAERCTAITTFLNYACANVVIRKSKALQEFLAKAEEIFQPLDQTAPLEAVKSSQPEASTEAAAVAKNEENNMSTPVDDKTSSAKETEATAEPTRNENLTLLTTAVAVEEENSAAEESTDSEEEFPNDWQLPKFAKTTVGRKPNIQDDDNGTKVSAESNVTVHHETTDSNNQVNNETKVPEEVNTEGYDAAKDVSAMIFQNYTYPQSWAAPIGTVYRFETTYGTSPQVTATYGTVPYTSTVYMAAPYAPYGSTEQFGTTASYGATSASYGTTSASCGTTPASYGTTTASYGTTSAPYGTTTASYGTTTASYETTSAPYDITTPSYGTRAASYGTTTAPYGTTAASNRATVASDRTTVASERTTVASDRTTTAAFGTTTSYGTAVSCGNTKSNETLTCYGSAASYNGNAASKNAANASATSTKATTKNNGAAVNSFSQQLFNSNTLQNPSSVDYRPVSVPVFFPYDEELWNDWSTSFMDGPAGGSGLITVEWQID